MYLMHWKSRCAVAMALLLGLCFVFSGQTPVHAAPQDSAFARIVQAAPIAPNVDVYLDAASQPLLSNFKFGVVTGYLTLAPGSHSVAVTPAGQPLSKAIMSTSMIATTGTTYTMALFGDSQTKPGLSVFTDDNSVVSDLSKVRFYHLSTDAGPAALTMSFTLGGKTSIPSIGFAKASHYFSVKPGDYQFYVTLANGTNTVPQPLTLDANHVTSIFGVGQVHGQGDTAFRFVTVTADAVPTAMPHTGFAPGSTQPNSDPVALTLYLVIGLVIGAIVLVSGVTRRMARYTTARYRPSQS
jgi:uncharacterized protein DUF4397